MVRNKNILVKITQNVHTNFTEKNSKNTQKFFFDFFFSKIMVLFFPDSARKTIKKKYWFKNDQKLPKKHSQKKKDRPGLPGSA